MNESGNTSDSAKIFARLRAAGIRLRANDPIGEHLSADDMKALEEELIGKVEGLLETLLIDTSQDHNTEKTAARVSKMFLREVFAGRYQKPPDMTDFPNVAKLDELYTVGPITVRSACAHHLCPIEGKLWCGVIPSDRVIGLSKFARIARWVMARPQIQEEAVVQLADLLEELIKPRGLAVVINARHSCMTWRGVMEHGTTMTSSVTRGILREAPASRSEFFRLISSQGFTT